MTKSEAIAEMQKGKRVTHLFFGEGEWIGMNEKGEIITEEGYTHNASEFWGYRAKELFEDDWEIYCDCTHTQACVDCCESKGIPKDQLTEIFKNTDGKL